MLYGFFFFFCISNIVAFKITFSTCLLFLSILFQVILKYVQHYQQYLLFLLNFIVVKTELLKTVSLFTTVLGFLNSCSCDAMTNLACFNFLPSFPFNTINLLLIFHCNSQLYTEKDFNCCVSDSFNWANGDVLVFRPKVCYCNTFKGRCCSKCCC